MYQASKGVYSHNLKNLSAMLKMAAKHAKDKGFDSSVLVNARLAPDMLPLAAQIMIATDHAKGGCARLAGVDAPVFADTESTIEELQARIKRTLDFIGTLKADQFVGSESKAIVMKIPIGTLSFSGQDFLNGWSLPNFYFHITTAYNILRHNGVGLGKGNFMGMVPGMSATGKIAKMMGIKPSKKAKPAAKKAKPAAAKAKPAAKKVKKAKKNA